VKLKPTFPNKDLKLWLETYRACFSTKGGTSRSLLSVTAKSIERALAGNCGLPVGFIVRQTRSEAGRQEYEQLLQRRN
jgi:hypothetical protein